MPALVAIEIVAPQSTDASLITSMLDACNAASAHHTCVSATRAQSQGARSQARRARVEWPSPTRAMITLESPTSAPLTRALDFKTSDEAQERWRTVGFTTALLASTQPTLPEHDTPARQPNVLLTLRAVGERRANQLPPQAGAEFRLDGRAWQAPWLLGLSGQYSATEWDAPGLEATARWLELGAGVALMFEPAKELDLFVRVDALLQRLEVSGRKKKVEDHATLWQPGARLALDLTWPFHPSWFAVVGAHTALLWSPVHVEVEGKLTETLPRYTAGLSLGVQYRFQSGH